MPWKASPATGVGSIHRQKAGQMLSAKNPTENENVFVDDNIIGEHAWTEYGLSVRTLLRVSLNIHYITQSP